MKSFIQLQEQASEEKLTHLEHAEDHPINAGHEGTVHAMNTLRQTAATLQGKASDARLMTKYDGSPSIVFGRHPETGKFFVASKSAFNKTPKINYTPEDVDRNHGHAPGLVQKLKAALEHLPKSSPEHGIYQADIMHTPSDVVHQSGNIHFKPNTITYSTPGNSEEGEKIKRSKIGVAVHTAYKGTNFDSMRAEYGTDISHFQSHPDVHVISTHYNPKQAQYSTKDHGEFSKHMQEATKISKKLKPEHYSILDEHSHRDNVKTYINKTVRENTSPNVAGYKEHLKHIAQKQADKVKTVLSKDRYLHAADNAQKHVNENKGHFENLLGLHSHLQQAKNVLVNTMSRNQDYAHTIAGQKTKPEGYVSVINNRPTKLTDRYEFNRMNFLRNKE